MTTLTIRGPIKEGDTVSLVLSGNISLLRSQDLLKKIKETLRMQACTHLIIDLTKVKFFHNSGLPPLELARRFGESNKIQVTLRLSKAVKEKLTALRVLDLYHWEEG